MEQNPSSVVDTDLAKAREATGIMEGAQEDPITEPEQQTNNPESKPASENDPDNSPAPEEGKEESDGEDEDEGKANEREKSNAHKPTSAERQLFKGLKRTNRQIEDLTAAVSKLVESSAKSASVVDQQTAPQNEASDKIRSFASALAAKQGLDEEGITEMVEGIVSLVKDLTTKEQATLPPDVQQDLKQVQKFLKEETERSEQTAIASHIEEEWNALLPALRKQYPNAGDSELAQAQEKMFEIAHSEKGGVKINDTTIKGFPIDFVLYQNRKDFDTILKVASNKRGAEGGSRELVDTTIDDDDDIDMDPESMTPEKWQRRQQQKIRENSKDRSDVRMIQ